MPNRVTLADVAERAGVSKTAVSLILNDRPGSRLSEELATRVRAAAAELNYRPNPAARSLRLGKTQIVGFISDDVSITRYASAMIRGALDVAQHHDHTVLIAETGSDPERRNQAVEAILDRRPDGLVFGLMGAKEIDVPDHQRRPDRHAQRRQLRQTPLRGPRGVRGRRPDRRAVGSMPDTDASASSAIRLRCCSIPGSP